VRPGGLGLDAALRIGLFVPVLVYIYTRARARPRIIPLFWGATESAVHQIPVVFKYPPMNL